MTAPPRCVRAGAAIAVIGPASDVGDELRELARTVGSLLARRGVVVITGGLGEPRNALVVGAADAVIAVGGSWGTLSEIALARRTGKPVVTIHAWGVTYETGQPLPLLVATSAAEAVRRATDAIAGREQDRA